MAAQKNHYRIYDSMYRPTEMYVTASNKKEALAEIKKKVASKEFKLPGQAFMVIRDYNGGVRG